MALRRGNVISLVIILNEVLPQSLLCHICRTFADFLHFFFRFIRKQRNRIFDTIRHLRIIIVRTMQHFYPIIDAMLILQAVHPKAEACQISSNCRYAERYTLQAEYIPKVRNRKHRHSNPVPAIYHNTLCS